MKQISETSKLNPYILPKHDWKVQTTAAFRFFSRAKEIAAEGRIATPADFESGSPASDKVAQKIVDNIETGSKVVNCEVCYLQADVILGLPGSGRGFSPSETVVIGLVDDKGNVSPVAFNPDFVLVQMGHGPFAVRYDENTDLGRIFKDVLTPRSFI